MHLLNDDIAWILPPRTGSRYTLQTIGQHGFKLDGRDNEGHQVAVDRLGDHRLYMNIRNPYTRIQSMWRMLQMRDKPSPEFVGTFDDYMAHLEPLESLDGLELYKKPWHYLVNGHRFPRPLVTFLTDSYDHDKPSIPVSRVTKFIRLESFYEDLTEVGFPPTLPKMHGWGYKSINMEWFADKPKAVETINRLYAEDFRTFNYAGIV